MLFTVLMAAANMHMPAPATASCLGSLGAVLAATEFSGSLDCVHDRLSTAHMGRTHAGAHSFDIYDYRYKLAPVCRDCAVHGGQRVIILRDGRYLGQYKPDGVKVRVVANQLQLTATDPAISGEGRTVTVRFTAAGPPTRVLVGGDVLELFK